jgi:hypothetical protein
MSSVLEPLAMPNGVEVGRRLQYCGGVVVARIWRDSRIGGLGSQRPRSPDQSSPGSYEVLDLAKARPSPRVPAKNPVEYHGGCDMYHGG